MPKCRRADGQRSDEDARAQPEVEAAPEAAVYANDFEIGYNAFEVLFDFRQDYDGVERSRVARTRIVTAPAYAKVFRGLLDRTIVEYEATFGPITEAPTPAEGEDPDPEDVSGGSPSRGG